MGEPEHRRPRSAVRRPNLTASPARALRAVSDYPRYIDYEGVIALADANRANGYAMTLHLHDDTPGGAAA